MGEGAYHWSHLRVRIDGGVHRSTSINIPWELLGAYESLLVSSRIVAFNPVLVRIEADWGVSH